jgi:hypothetical protein
MRAKTLHAVDEKVKCSRSMDDMMLGSAAIVAVLAPLCLAAYRSFAVTVYRDYYSSSADLAKDAAITRDSSA